MLLARSNVATWQGHKGIDCRFMWSATFGLMAQKYERRYGLDRKHLNRIAQNNYTNAKHTPLAQTRQWNFELCAFTDDDALNLVIDPGSRRQDCGQITGGACGMVLAGPRFAAEHARRLGVPLARFPRILGGDHNIAPLRFKDKLARSVGEPYVFPMCAKPSWTPLAAPARKN